MGQGIFGVGDLIDVEEHRARDMAGRELGLGIAPLRRQIPGAVDDPHIRRREMGGEPVGADQRVGVGVAHDTRAVANCGRRSSQSGTGRPFERMKAGLNSLL
jgi:hypothetical protein